MSQPGYQVRRATVDDLPFLVPLWTEMRFSVPELERRVTDFQVVTDSSGIFLGALAFEIIGRQGRLHSEVFTDFGLAECLRELLWERIHRLVTNHGVARLWTVESAPFWTRNGFQPADAEALKKLPETWATFAPAWLTLQLRDEELIQKALDHEFARFREHEQRETAAAMRRTRIMKVVATVLAILLAIFVIVISISLLGSRLRIPGR